MFFSSQIQIKHLKLTPAVQHQETPENLQDICQMRISCITYDYEPCNLRYCR